MICHETSAISSCRREPPATAHLRQEHLDDAVAMPANLPPVLLSCFKTLLTPLTEEERRCHQLAVAANFKAFNLSLVHVLNVSTACNALCLKPNAPDAGFIFMCDPLGTGATPEPSHA